MQVMQQVGHDSIGVFSRFEYYRINGILAQSKYSAGSPDSGTFRYATDNLPDSSVIIMAIKEYRVARF
jgi:hypothetical protein